MRPSTPLMLMGAGGHCRSLMDVARRQGIEVSALSDPAASTGRMYGTRVLRSDEELVRQAIASDAVVLPAVGSCQVLLGLLQAFPRAPWGVLVASSSTVAETALIGSATVILEHAHVGPAADVGRGVIVNTAAVVEHDCTLGTAVHISPGAIVAGGASIGSGSWIGAGAVILEGRTLGENVIVGAGAVVTTDIASGSVVVGIPARAIASRPRTNVGGDNS